MSLSVEEQVERLLDMEDRNLLLAKTAEVKDEEVLYVLGHRYNWDNGFALPKAIIDNPNCRLSTALALFYLADGMIYLKNKAEAESGASPEWRDFVTDLYDRIVQGRFDKSDIEFIPPLNKAEHYKLKKKLDRSEYVFIERTGAAC